MGKNVKIFSGVLAGTKIDNPELTREQYLIDIGLEDPKVELGNAYFMRITDVVQDKTVWGYIYNEKCMCSWAFLRPGTEPKKGQKIYVRVNSSGETKRHEKLFFVEEEASPTV